MINFFGKIGDRLDTCLNWLFSLSSKGWKSAIWGGIIGFFLVLIIEQLRKPKVKLIKFEYENFNVPQGLYKIKIKILPRFLMPKWFTYQPGITILEIRYRDKIQFAKWDEMPNPLRDDDPQKFEASMVPQTFYQMLFLDRFYSIPIIHKDKENNLSAFCGWWFGRNFGYGKEEDYQIDRSEKFCLILRGNNVYWKKQIKTSDILAKRC